MKRNKINFQIMFSYIDSVFAARFNASGISSYIRSPVVSSICTEVIGEDSSGIRLYSAYGTMTAKCD